MSEDRVQGDGAAARRAAAAHAETETAPIPRVDAGSEAVLQGVSRSGRPEVGSPGRREAGPAERGEPAAARAGSAPASWADGQPMAADGPARPTAEGLSRPARSTSGPPPRSLGSRRARLALQRIDPWSVFLFTFVTSLFLAVMLVVAVAVLDAVLSSAGVLRSVNTLISDLSQDSSGRTDVITSSGLLSGAAVLAGVNVVLVTVLATLGAFLYNLCARLTGGIEVTLGERD